MTDIKKTGPRDVFLHLLAIATLYLAAVNFGVLFFQLINIYLPDPLADFYRLQDIRGTLRWALASLVIVFPVYVWVTWFLERDMGRAPQKRSLRSRRWLLHLTLFLAAVIIIGDLVSLVFNFLQGELTLRFFLKVLVVLMISGAVFGYYLLIIRKESRPVPAKLLKVFAWTVIVAAVAAVLAGFFTAGTPAQQRARRFDDRRVSDLQNIQSQIIFFWQQKERLPSSLNELGESILGYVLPADPETAKEYEYRLFDDLRFELCANFRTESLQPGKLIREQLPPPSYFPDGFFGADFGTWTHGVGRHCFQRTIDPEIYRPVKD